eukprot:CAMPEP_0170588692 /NCGR_PEP_ID=MMETSP0224-20130122/10968_1 /TAXON_ID=285029 /ORGANISM="Togula jolla, Strain CCCM 725" /LENGTH=176 /DNA_ID=CAMNT_0010912431 /DNA_START=935 /DNA_END=1467 /DNA_ORIENTATION=-
MLHSQASPELSSTCLHTCNASSIGAWPRAMMLLGRCDTGSPDKPMMSSCGVSPRGGRMKTVLFEAQVLRAAQANSMVNGNGTSGPVSMMGTNLQEDQGDRRSDLPPPSLETGPSPDPSSPPPRPKQRRTPPRGEGDPQHPDLWLADLPVRPPPALHLLVDVLELHPSSDLKDNEEA